MSYTTILAAFQDGQLQPVTEIRNSWRAAMWIWNEIARKYCGMDTFPMPLGEDGMEKCRKVWNMADSERIKEIDRLALLTTLDGFLVEARHFERVAQALDEFQPTSTNLKEQAVVIRRLAKEGARAIGWHQTSTAEDPWGSQDDEGNYIPYNIDTGKKHQWIFPR